MSVHKLMINNPIGGGNFESLVIDNLRFPLAIFVVFIHCGIAELASTSESAPILHVFLQVIDLTVRIAVPCFFLISGYLFYQHLSEWDWNTYGSKLKRRIYTLLIPYIIWNLIPFCVDLLPQVAGMVTGRIAPINVAMYLRENFVGVFYSGVDGLYPWDFPLWFVRDLMIMVLLSPIFYVIIKRTSVISILLLSIAFITEQWVDVPGFSIQAFLFYNIGAYFAINQRSMVNTCWESRCVIGAITLCALVAYMLTDLSIVTKYALKIYVYSGVFLMFVISSVCIKNGILPKKALVSSCFFIYAYHAAYLIPLVGSPCTTIIRVMKFIIPGEGLMQHTICNLATPFIAVAIAIPIVHALKIISPKLASILAVTK